MSRTISFAAVFKALLVGLVLSYVLCLAGDLIFGWTMYQVWAPLLPGFTWPLTVGGFIVGLIWLVIYAAYIPLVLLLPYKYFVRAEQVSI